MAGPIRISILADDRASRVFGSVGGQVGMLSGRVGKYGKAMGLAVAGGAVVAGAATIKWASDSVSSLARIERINTQTQTAIKSTGGAAGVTAKHVENLAGRLENLTATEAETTQENSNLLLTFTNVQNRAGKGNAIFDRTVKTFVDMQRAIPSASMTSLGKALNDPIKGVSALTRVGVSFTDQQKKQIASLVEHNKTMDAQKVILGELTKEFGGSGEAFAKTAEGQKALLGHAFGTLGETIFAPLLPWLTKVTSETTVFVNYLNENVGPALITVQGYIAPVVDVLSNLFDTAGSGNSMLSTSIAGVAAAYTGFYSAVWPIILALADGIRAKWGEIGPDVEHIFTSVQNTVRDALSIVSSILKGATAAVLLIWNRWGDTLTKFTATSLKNVISALRGAFEIIEGVFQVVSSLLKGDWSGVWDGIQKILSGALRLIVASLSQAWNMVTTGASIAWSLLKSIIAKAWSAAVDAVQAGIRAELNLLKSLPGRIKGAIGDLGGLLLDAGRQLIDGFVQGIRDKIGDVEGTLTSLTGKLTSWKGPPEKDKTLLRPAGRLLMEGLIRGIEDGSAGVEKVLKRITDLIKKRIDLKDNKKEAAREREVLKSLKGQYDALVKNGKAQDRVNAALDAARDKLKDLKQQAADWAKSVSDAIVATGDVTQVTGDNLPLNANGIIAGLVQRVNRAQQFSNVITELTNKGLNKTNLQQLIDAGVDGGLATAQAIAAGGASAIRTINLLTQRLTLVGDQLGDSTSKTFYAAGIRAAEALVSKLEAEAARLDRLAKRMADQLLARLEGQAHIRTGGGSAARVAAAGPGPAATGPQKVEIHVTAPVGSSSADIGRELQGHLSAFLSAGGRQVAVS